MTIQLKIGMKLLHRENLGWDEQLDGELKELWVKLINLILNCEDVVFYRATKPRDAVGDSELIGFFDGSDLAFAAVVYVRWRLQSNAFCVILVASRARISPLWGTSTPRLELNGATMMM